MKTKRTIFLAAIIILLSQISLMANTSEKIRIARNKLKSEIAWQVKQAPFELVNSDAEGNTVHIYFTVNEQGLIDEVNVEGDNEDLVNYVTIRIRPEELSAHPELSGKKCYVPVRYKVL